MRLLAGRGFTVADGAGAQPRVILNASAARFLFGTVDAVGRTFALPRAIAGSGAPPARVVGIMSDALQRDPTIDAAPELLLYARAKSTSAPTLAVRSSAPASVAITQVRQVLRDVDPTLAPVRLEALLALTIASIGLYAVVSYLVSERRAEIGIRRSIHRSRSGRLSDLPSTPGTSIQWRRCGRRREVHQSPEGQAPGV